MRKIDYCIEPSYDGFTVEKFLMGEKKLSRRLITKLKYSDGGITLNGNPIRTVDVIAAGDVLSVVMCDDKTLEENASLDVPVAYEDDDIVVFDKPCGMPAHPSILHHNDTLGNYYAYLYKELSFRPVNRLDRDTSGLCVVAKNAYSAAVLQHGTDKTYYAAVCGLIVGSGKISAPIAREADTIIKRKVSDDGQEAITEYEAVKSANGYTLLKIKLLTGRTHQIRVHFSHIGYPLAGDELYGGDCTDISRQALHCGKIILTHPVTNKKIIVRSKLPDDIEDLFV